MTPPEGNNSTRIASTAYVQKELIPYEKTADLGALAHQNTINYAGNQITNKPTLGALAAQNYITTDNIQYEQYLFVDASRGSDSNPGDNVNYPLKTIYAAIQKAKSPATTMIQIYPGTYTEMPNINNKNIDLYSLSEDENNDISLRHYEDHGNKCHRINHHVFFAIGELPAYYQPDRHKRRVNTQCFSGNLY